MNNHQKLLLTLSYIAILPALAQAQTAGGFSTVTVGTGTGYSGGTPPTNGMIVQSSTGIGTTAPSGLLNVYGGTTILNGDTPYADQLYLEGKSNPNQRLTIGYNTTSNYGAIQVVLSGTAPEPLILQGSGGFVGIGTTVPFSTLHVRAATDQDIRLGGTRLLASGTSITSANDADTSNVPLEIRASQFYLVGGNVGIGTSSPAVLLDVAGTVLSRSSTNAVFMDSSGGTYGRVQSMNAGLSANTNLVLQPQGSNVGIGGTSPAVSLDLGQRTDAVALPVGTTGQRPTGSNGDIRYNTTTNALEAFVNGTWAALSGNAYSIFSSGQLLCGGSAPPCHSSSISYCPYKGNMKTTAFYGVYTIPAGTATSGCLTANLGSMYIGGTASQLAAVNTLYYVYLINVAGTTYLDLETTDHVRDATTGIEIMSGTNGYQKTLVGMIHTDASRMVATKGMTTTSGDTNTVATWDNRQPTATNCIFQTPKQTTSGTPVLIGTENSCYFMSWGDAAQVSSQQNFYAGANADNQIDTYFCLDATTASTCVSNNVSLTWVSSLALGTSTLPYYSAAIAPATFYPSENYHASQIAVSSTAGSYANFPASQRTTVFTIQ